MTTAKKLTPILGNRQALDGGAMFGNVPKAMWSQWMPPDTENRIELACRALLVQEADRNILFEAGVGAFFPPKLKSRYGVIEEEHILLASLGELGLSDKDIDIVVLSHLHFDHAGGLLSAYKEDEPSPKLLFPQAKFVASKGAFVRAEVPCPRDRASFIPELNAQLVRSERLVLVEDNAKSHPLLGEDYCFYWSHGHTPSMMLTEITLREAGVVFGADLIPGTPWVHLPVTMGYDRFPECLIEEKREILEYLVSQNAWLFYTHDPGVAFSQVISEKGRFLPRNLANQLK